MRFLFLFSFSFLLFSSYGTTESSQPREVCKTDLCIQISDYLRANINDTIDPCDDFRKYVCGTYAPVNTSIDSEFVERRVESIQATYLRELNRTDDGSEEEWMIYARRYYKSCLTSTIPSLQKFIDDLYAVFQEMPIEVALGTMISNYSLPVVIAAERFSRDDAKFILKEAPTIFLHAEFFLRRRMEDFKEHYRRQVNDIVEHHKKTIGEYKMPYNTTIEEFVKFEEKLALFVEPLELLAVKTVDMQMTADEFISKYSHPHFNMSLFLSTFLNMNQSSTFDCTNNIYVLNALNLFEDDNYRLIAKDLAFHRLIYNLLSRIHFVVNTEANSDKRQNRCLTKTASEFWPLRMRAQRAAVPVEFRKLFSTARDVLVPLFREKVENSENLPEAEKKMGLKKLDVLTFNEDFPSSMLEINDTLTQELYSTHSSMTDDDFLQNTMSIYRITGQQAMSGLRIGDYVRITPIAQGFYNQISMQMSAEWALTTFSFTPAFIEMPYIAYARLLNIMAHELSHLIDPISWFYTADRVIRPYHTWTPSFTSHLEEVTNCQQKIYRSLPNHLPVDHDPTHQVTIELFADILGLDIALLAYRNLTSSLPLLPGPLFEDSMDAVFFTAISTVPLFCTGETPGNVDKAVEYFLLSMHPHGRKRVRMMAKESKYFDSAFNCPINTSGTCKRFL